MRNSEPERSFSSAVKDATASDPPLGGAESRLLSNEGNDSKSTHFCAKAPFARIFPRREGSVIPLRARSRGGTRTMPWAPRRIER